MFGINYNILNTSPRGMVEHYQDQFGATMLRGTTGHILKCKGFACDKKNSSKLIKSAMPASLLGLKY